MQPGYKHLRRLHGVILASGILVFASSALAFGDSDKEAIRALSNEAAADFEAGRFDVAHEKFVRAYDVARVPRLAVWLARTHERLHQLVSAYEYYRQAIRLERSELWVGDAQQQAQREAEQELAALAPRLPRLVIEQRGAATADLRVKIDDVEVPVALLGVERFVDPGRHEISGTANGRVVHETVDLAEGARSTIRLDFESAPALQPPLVGGRQVDVRSASAPTHAGSHPASSSQKTWGWVAIGVGSVGILTGLGFGAATVAKYDGLNRDCPNRVCNADDESRVESYRTMRTLSLVGFVVGGVGIATGLSLVLTSPKPTTSARAMNVHTSIGLWASPQFAGVNGTF